MVTERQILICKLQAAGIIARPEKHNNKNTTKKQN